MNKPNATRSRKFFGRLQRPGVTLALVTLVLLDVFTLAPGHEYRQGGSRVSNVIGSLREPAVRQETPPTRAPHAYFAWYADTDELRQVDRAGRRDAGWTIFYDVYSSFGAEYSGWWGLTREQRGFSWTFDESGRPGGKSTPTGIHDRVNRAFVELIRSSGDPYWIHEAERATSVPGRIGYQEKRVRWQGWARNGASALLLVLFVLSTAWVWRDARERRRWRRQARRICPDCGYDLGTIANETPCPECGEAHPPRPAESIRRPGLFDRVWSRVRTPAGTTCLAALLITDAVLLPKGDKGFGSRVGNHLPTPAFRVDQGDGRPVEKLYLAVLMKDGAPVFKVVGPDWPGEKNPSASPRGGSDDLVELADGERVPMTNIVVVTTIGRDSHTTGFWAPVRRYVYCNHGGWGWDGLPEEIRKNFNERMITWFDAAGMPQWAADLRLREIHSGYHDSTIWIGHVHNAAAMGAGLALVCSLGWMPARLRRRRGRCVYCLASRGEPGRCRVCGEPGDGEEKSV